MGRTKRIRSLGHNYIYTALFNIVNIRTAHSHVLRTICLAFSVYFLILYSANKPFINRNAQTVFLFYYYYYIFYMHFSRSYPALSLTIQTSLSRPRTHTYTLSFHMFMVVGKLWENRWNYFCQFYITWSPCHDAITAKKFVIIYTLEASGQGVKTYIQYNI